MKVVKNGLSVDEIMDICLDIHEECKRVSADGDYSFASKLQQRKIALSLVAAYFCGNISYSDLTSAILKE